MAWYTCTVNGIGPAADGTETPSPVVYINLTDTSKTPVFTNQWFFAADGGQNLMLAVGLAAMTNLKHVAVEVPVLPNVPVQLPPIEQLFISLPSRLTAVTRMYLNAT